MARLDRPYMYRALYTPATKATMGALKGAVLEAPAGSRTIGDLSVVISGARGVEYRIHWRTTVHVGFQDIDRVHVKATCL